MKKLIFVLSRFNSAFFALISSFCAFLCPIFLSLIPALLGIKNWGVGNSVMLIVLPVALSILLLAVAVLFVFLTRPMTKSKRAPLLFGGASAIICAVGEFLLISPISKATKLAESLIENIDLKIISNGVLAGGIVYALAGVCLITVYIFKMKNT